MISWYSNWLRLFSVSVTSCNISIDFVSTICFGGWYWSLIGAVLAFLIVGFGVFDMVWGVFLAMGWRANYWCWGSDLLSTVIKRAITYKLVKNFCFWNITDTDQQRPCKSKGAAPKCCPTVCSLPIEPSFRWSRSYLLCWCVWLCGASRSVLLHKHPVAKSP